ncbi:unnamed protein product [Brachionus calyciflorus]|uniref:Uncharacterized protein n=1 Tax=Brachionus calyciflorus TaxID=104777 RepID=A0A813RAX1_9BILA|nr:unnamed protein product [Brachionus calyciflorus]
MENLEILILPISRSIIGEQLTMSEKRHMRNNSNGNENELETTDDSNDMYTQSSVYSFRNNLSSTHSFKSRTKSKKQLRFTNMAARRFFRHKVRIVIALQKLVDFAYEKFK